MYGGRGGKGGDLPAPPPVLFFTLRRTEGVDGGRGGVVAVVSHPFHFQYSSSF